MSDQLSNMSEAGLLSHCEGLRPEVAEVAYQQTNEECKSCGDSSDSDNGEHAENCNDNLCNGELNRDEQKSKCRRRRKKRKWVPYCKLSWDERCKVDERDSRRANRIRAEMQASGHALAPYNTTQFLMEDHRLYEPYHVCPVRDGTSEKEIDSNMFSSESCNIWENFLHKDFTKTYESIHESILAERLASMNKSELIRELGDMEDKLDKLRNKLEAAQEKPRTNVLTSCTAEELLKAAVFREEIEKLSKENEFLKQENYCLENQILKGEIQKC